MCCSHLQCEVVLQARGDVQQRSAGLTCTKHQLYMPGDGGRRHVVPLQQTVAQETLRACHNYSKKRLKSTYNVRREYEGGRRVSFTGSESLLSKLEICSLITSSYHS